MKLLNHPNIVKFKEAIETTTHIFIVTELIRGGDLYNFVNNKGYLEGQFIIQNNIFQ